MMEKFFNGELKVQIMKYCKRLEAIRKEYDVLVFMARKSICFYDALMLNGEISTINSDVVITTSSRVLSYDCEFLRNKKIALIDDIVLRGNTLRETISFLQEKGIDGFDVYYIASQKSENENLKIVDEFLKEPILELTNSEILMLSNAITGYISASACSYNVDYPMFYMDSACDDFFEEYIQKNNCTRVPSYSSGNNTYMYVQNFSSEKYFEQFVLDELNALKTKNNEAILKLRIFYRKECEKRKVVVIPIIVLPELNAEQIQTIFRSITSSDLHEMVKNTDSKKEIANMLSVIQYILSYQLFVSIFESAEQFKFEYGINNQNYIFPYPYNESVLECLHKCETVPSSNIKDVEVIDDFFELSEVYRYFFDFIGNRHQSDDHHKVRFCFKRYWSIVLTNVV